jgi:hypothetical protein
MLRKLLYLKQVFPEREQLRASRNQLEDERDKLKAEKEQLETERDHLKDELCKLQGGWPPGHYYSPIPSIEEVKSREDEIFGKIPNKIHSVDLNVEEQITLLHNLKEYYHDLPFQAHKKENLRYFFENPNYSYGEATILFCMTRYIQPGKIIEIGSGYSSCVILDTNELFFGNSIDCTFIDPHPELLHSLIKESDIERIKIIQKNVQDINIDIFSELSPGDILCVDSSHVSKIDSDVNHIFFEILPHIEKGVYIHFHDVCYPFEYPKEWIYEGRAWNEAYLLRAFLQYNSVFKLQFFSSFLVHFYEDMLSAHMPILMQNPGTSIWIKKT